MAKKAERTRAIQFICDLLENSGLYLIENRDDRKVQVREKPGIVEGRRQPLIVKVVLANSFKIDEFQAGYSVNRGQGVYVAPILYKDGETAFVRVVDRNPSWRAEKSLKRYDAQEINRMLHLRGVEKKFLELFGNTLSYYQPPTANLEESIRDFRLGPVVLDYSHISADDPRADYLENRESIDYKLPQEVGLVTGVGRMELFDGCRARIVPVLNGPTVVRAKPKQYELF